MVTARQCRPGGRLLSRSAVLLYLFGAACRQAAPPLAAGAAEVPRLEPVATAPVMGLSVRSAVALGADGAWLFAAPRVTGSAMVFVAPEADEGVPIGGVGEGPGEARMAIPIRVDSAEVVGYDLAGERLTTWTRSGDVVATRWMSQVGIPLLALPSGELLTTVRNQHGLIPTLFDPATGRTRQPIAAEDSAFSALVADGRDEMSPPVIGAWADGLVVGDGIAFRFGLFDQHGRQVGRIDLDLPERHRDEAGVERELAALETAGIVPRGDRGRVAQVRQQLRDEVLPWVSHVSPPRSDARGRLWIVREMSFDSVAVEIFAAAEHLGSLKLPCPDYRGAWALHDGWFGLVCAPADSTVETDAVLQRYRIIDAAGEPAPPL